MIVLFVFCVGYITIAKIIKIFSSTKDSLGPRRFIVITHKKSVVPGLVQRAILTLKSQVSWILHFITLGVW